MGLTTQSLFSQVMKTPVAGKGKLLTQISLFWFDLFKDICPNHVITTQIEDMPEKVRLAANLFSVWPIHSGSK
jgi:phosphoribosylaminoimidazole-succinocarboxamide synthase